MSKVRSAIVSLALGISFTTGSAAAQVGAVDPTFQVGTGFDLSPACVALDAQGRVLVGGNFGLYNGTIARRIVRLLGNGQLDTSFNSGAGPNQSVEGIEVLPDGKILIVGSFASYGPGIPCPGVARLHPDGSLDTTFQPVVASPTPVIWAVAQQPDGSYLLGGAFNSFGGAPYRRLVRLDSTGGIDTTFNPSPDGTVLALALRPDGRILAGGGFGALAGVWRNGIGQLFPNGAIDPFFVGLADDGVYAMAVQPDGKVVIGGSFSNYAGANAYNIARLTANGLHDASFQSNPGANSLVTSIVSDGLGGVLVGGDFTQLGGAPCPYLGRLLPDGTVDPAFVTSNGANGTVLDIAVDPSGTAVIVGFFTSYRSVPRKGIARVFWGTTCYLDADGDGYGAGTGILGQNACGAGYSSVSGDCDDSDPGVFPGAFELCDNIDNDCDGVTDEVLIESYCTPGVSYDGCVATMSGVGVPSSSSASGFQLLASGAPGQRLGLFYYGFEPRAVSPSIHSTSFFCVRPPSQRMSTLLSTGDVAQCNGVFSIDFNQWLQTHPAALGNPMLPGTLIYAQAWYRDPLALDRANLSDGLKFAICN